MPIFPPCRTLQLHEKRRDQSRTKTQYEHNRNVGQHVVRHVFLVVHWRLQEAEPVSNCPQIRGTTNGVASPTATTTKAKRLSIRASFSSGKLSMLNDAR
jgi:hypothetical protein